MTSKQQHILVCAPATAPMAVVGTTFEKRCSRCAQRVMIAPRGQRLLRRLPDAVILCLGCYLEVKPTGLKIMAGTSAEIGDAITRAIPNPWLKRN